jgi:hypothetical protein
MRSSVFLLFLSWLPIHCLAAPKTLLLHEFTSAELNAPCDNASLKSQNHFLLIDDQTKRTFNGQSKRELDWAVQGKFGNWTPTGRRLAVFALSEDDPSLERVYRLSKRDDFCAVEFVRENERIRTSATATVRALDYYLSLPGWRNDGALFKVRTPILRQFGDSIFNFCPLNFRLVQRVSNGGALRGSTYANLPMPYRHDDSNKRYFDNWKIAEQTLALPGWEIPRDNMSQSKPWTDNDVDFRTGAWCAPAEFDRMLLGNRRVVDLPKPELDDLSITLAEPFYSYQQVMGYDQSRDRVFPTAAIHERSGIPFYPASPVTLELMVTESTVASVLQGELLIELKRKVFNNIDSSESFRIQLSYFVGATPRPLKTITIGAIADLSNLPRALIGAKPLVAYSPIANRFWMLSQIDGSLYSVDLGTNEAVRWRANRSPNSSDTGSARYTGYTLNIDDQADRIYITEISGVQNGVPTGPRLLEYTLTAPNLLREIELSGLTESALLIRKGDRQYLAVRQSTGKAVFQGSRRFIAWINVDNLLTERSLYVGGDLEIGTYNYMALPDYH